MNGEGGSYFSSVQLFCCGMRGIDRLKQIWRDSVLCDVSIELMCQLS